MLPTLGQGACQCLEDAAVPAVMSARMMAVTGGPALRRITKPVKTLNLVPNG
jgi:hypothetical protein